MRVQRWQLREQDRGLPSAGQSSEQDEPRTIAEREHRALGLTLQDDDRRYTSITAAVIRADLAQGKTQY